MTHRICKEFRFEAAHHLPNHEGKCQRPHGHSYKVEVSLVGELQTEGSSDGMVVDFSVISEWWKRVIHPLVDHYDLNEVLPFEYHPTTAEHIAQWIYDTARGDTIMVDYVKVWETATGWAMYPS